MKNKDLVYVLTAMCEAVERNQAYLCELDSAVGDGDHGVSMAKSFRAVRLSLPALAESAPEEVLHTVGMTLISEVGGAMAPLFGTAFLRAAKSVSGTSAIGAAEFADMLAAAEAGIIQRGKAQPGDKTMVDALHPAVIAAREASNRGRGISETAFAAARAAQDGAVATRTMIARVGRASRLGERTLGHQDAGATSIAILLDAAALACESLEERRCSVEVAE